MRNKDFDRRLRQEAATATIRAKDISLATQYQRLWPRRGHKKALGAVKHSIICAV